MTGRLNQILEDQFVEAKAKAGTPTVRKLQKGLRVEMLYSHPYVTLKLGRDDTYPSPQEWTTIGKYFPFPIPDEAKPIQKQERGRYIIAATFAARRPEQLKF